jgi:hypothetical protein
MTNKIKQTTLILQKQLGEITLKNLQDNKVYESLFELKGVIEDYLKMLNHNKFPIYVKTKKFDEAIKSFELQIRKHHEKSKSHNRESLRHKPLADID